jgi:hypothetical protein
LVRPKRGVAVLQLGTARVAEDELVLVICSNVIVKDLVVADHQAPEARRRRSCAARRGFCIHLRHAARFVVDWPEPTPSPNPRTLGRSPNQIGCPTQKLNARPDPTPVGCEIFALIQETMLTGRGRNDSQQPPSRGEHVRTMKGDSPMEGTLPQAGARRTAWLILR